MSSTFTTPKVSQRHGLGKVIRLSQIHIASNGGHTKYRILTDSSHVIVTYKYLSIWVAIPGNEFTIFVLVIRASADHFLNPTKEVFQARKGILVSDTNIVKVKFWMENCNNCMAIFVWQYITVSAMKNCSKT